MKMSDKVSMIVSGYMKETFTKYTPDIILQKIMLFYGHYNIPFNLCIYNNEFKSFNTEITFNKIYINRLSKFLRTTDNEIYCYGDSSDGQMGISTPKRSKVTVLTKPNYTDISNDSIVLFSQGKANHVCFVYTEENKLYYMGRDYQHASYKIHKKPELIHTTFKSSLMSIECGGFHGLLLTVNGELYSYGQRTSIKYEKNGDRWTAVYSQHM